LIVGTNFSGGFTNIVLPPLAGNLVWNTNTLNSSGTLSVVALTSPTISAAGLSGGNLILTGFGGVNNWPFYLLTATNLESPDWQIIATNTFDAGGNFSLTNSILSPQPRGYYRLQLR
jgi:hypothetical protein